MEGSTAKKTHKLKMWQIIMISLVAGIAVGLGMSFMGGRDVAWIAAVCDFMSFLGNVFIRLIRMVIVPLVFFSIVSFFICSLRIYKMSVFDFDIFIIHKYFLKLYR